RRRLCPRRPDRPVDEHPRYPSRGTRRRRTGHPGPCRPGDALHRRRPTGPRSTPPHHSQLRLHLHRVGPGCRRPGLPVGPDRPTTHPPYVTPNHTTNPNHTTDPEPQPDPDQHTDWSITCTTCPWTPPNPWPRAPAPSA